ncbi:MAG: YifB family Mg chelatase-like AAA ATPase, partial [Wujia sp.]
MYTKIMSSAVHGVDGTIIGVEADVNDGLPMFTLVGYLSSSVREAGERVKAALKNSGFHFPPKRITINLSPADIKKDGSGFDLPIALAVLIAMNGSAVVDLSKTIVVGELSLDGRVNSVPGVLPMVYSAFEAGYEACIVPEDNISEASVVKGIQVIGVKNLLQAYLYTQGNYETSCYEPQDHNELVGDCDVDFAEIKGQEMLKRGMEIAAAGFHNVLMSGVAGAGKSMLASRLPGIMPALSFEEAIEVTKIYSICGLLTNNGELIKRRPFRSPHHTISAKALLGGGVVPKPGEISLAHRGVLFLDELPEFNKNVLEVMRQPLEEGKVTISRVNSTCVFPASIMLVAAMNPCPCGYYPDMKKCTCTPLQVKRYQDKISGPLLDRIDINMEVKPVMYNELFDKNCGESSETIRGRVQDAIEIQKNRYKDENICFNSQLTGKKIKEYIKLGYR